MHIKIVVYNEIHMKQGLEQVQCEIRNVSYERWTIRILDVS